MSIARHEIDERRAVEGCLTSFDFLDSNSVTACEVDQVEVPNQSESAALQMIHSAVQSADLQAFSEAWLQAGIITRQRFALQDGAALMIEAFGLNYLPVFQAMEQS
jgi:hypothetical protein